jgi:Cu-Zn family superoxide dismutase
MRHFRTALAAAALAAAPALAPAQQAGPDARAAMIGADGNEIGTLELTETPVGVLIRGELAGLPAGAHGFHIHETGACEPPFESAGDHHDPVGARHGFMAEDGPHTGDMPNIQAPESGAVAVEVLNGFIRIEGGELFDQDGSALVIHAGADDHRSQPSGDAGDPIACGVVDRS